MAIVKGYSSPTRGPVTADTLGFNGTTSILPRQIDSAIFYLDPSASPFTLVTDKAGNETTDNPKFEYYEKSLRPKVVNWDATGTGLDNATTEETLSVTESDYLQVGDVLLHPATGEKLIVKTRTDATTFEVIRGAAGSTPSTTYTAGDDIFIIGSAYAEGVDVPSPDEWQEVHKFNYTQIFRRAFGASGTREATKSYFGANRTKVSGEKAIEFAMDIERAFMFGGRSEVQSSGAVTPTAGTGVLRTTGGFTYWATENILDLNGSSLSEPDLEGWLEDVFAHTTSGDSRLLLASAPLITVLDMLAVDKIRTVNDPSMTFGIAVRQWLTSHGTLNIVKHRLMGDGGSPDYSNGGLCVDVKKLKMRTLAGRGTSLKRNRQNPGVDGWVDEYMAEVGLQLANAEVHGSILNVGAAA